MALSFPIRLYIDTNIYLDHILRRPGRSTDLFRQIAQGRFSGITSHFTFSEITAVLKGQGVSQDKIDAIRHRLEGFPNIQVVLHDPTMLLDIPNQILNTCAESRDALHFVIALHLAADRIVTRDSGFKNAVNSIIPCVTPEELLP